MMSRKFRTGWPTARLAALITATAVCGIPQAYAEENATSRRTANLPDITVTAEYPMKQGSLPDIVVTAPRSTAFRIDCLDQWGGRRDAVALTPRESGNDRAS